MRLSLRRRVLAPAGDTVSVELISDDDQAMAAWLESRAAALLSPDESALARMGSAVRAAFVATITETADGIQFQLGAGSLDDLSIAGGSGPAIAGHPKWSWNRRRGFAAICAVAILTLSTVGFAAAESGPGQPFYRLRLGIETVNQPPAGSQSRLDADLARADARLAEIAAASAAGNWSAAADAASAYADIVAGLTLPQDATTRAQAQARLHEQLARLEQLGAVSRGSATAALDKAIAAVSAVLGIAVPVLPAPASSPSPTATGADHNTTGAKGTSAGGPDVDRTARPSASGRTDIDGDPPGGPGSPGGGARPSPNPRPTFDFNDSRWGWPRQGHGR
jgi:hypothetical protein